MSLQNYFYNLRGLQSYNMQDKLNGINKNDKIYNKPMLFMRSRATKYI